MKITIKTSQIEFVYEFEYIDHTKPDNQANFIIKCIEAVVESSIKISSHD